MVNAEEMIKKDLEKIDRLAEEETGGSEFSELSTSGGWTREDVEIILDGVERIIDKILEYKKIETSKDREILLKEKEIEKTKYWYWLLAILGVTTLAGGILVIIFLLARGGVISSEGVSFLIGTIAGYLFSVFGGLISSALKPKESEV